MTDEIRNKLIDRVKRNPYVNHLGIDFTKVDDGVVEATMPLKDEQKQYSGIIHGGIVAALHDTIAGFAAYTLTPDDKDVLTAELNVQFMRGVWGESVRAIGQVTKPGRHIHFSECSIYCGDKLISKSTGTFCVVDKQI